MTPRQQKIVFSLFFSFLALWLFLILLGFFSSGKWTPTSVFANQSMLMLFEGAAILTSLFSLLLGLNFLGINLKPRVLRQILQKRLPLSTKRNNQTPNISSVNNSTKQKAPRKSKDRMKAFYLFGESEFNQCAHAFGYLGSVLKTESIPDECFGCPKLLECAKTTHEPS